MSLFIGNLSSRTRRSELERVFHRFGRCDVRLKDGYGFVVYDSTQNAEKALMVLQGKNICGQQLTITWSNKQPMPCKRFSKAARSYESLYGRSSARGEDYTNRKLHSRGRNDYKFGIKPQVGDDRRFNSADMLERDTSYDQDNIKDYIQEEHCEYREDLADKGGDVERSNLADNDRWTGQLHDQPNGNSVENGRELDQYERYRGFDRRADNENHHKANSDSSHAPQRSQDVLRREHLSEAPLEPPNHSTPQLTCYSCGGSGHKMRNCPRETNSQRKVMRIGHRYNDDLKRKGRAEDKLIRYGSGYQRKLQSYKAHTRLGDEGKASGSVGHQRLMKNRSPNSAKEAGRVRRQEREGKKRRRNFGTPNKHIDKKAKRSGSLPIHSDYTESRSHSTSRSFNPKPKSGLRSRSRSVTSRSYSSTFNSKSRSTSHYSRSSHTKSIPRSKSHKSLSSSEPLGRPLPSSPNKVPTSVKATSANAVTPKSNEILVDQAQPGDVSETAELEKNMVVKTYSSFKLENDMDKSNLVLMSTSSHDITNQSTQQSEKATLSTSSHDIANQSTQQSEKATLTVRTLPSETMKETGHHQNSDASVIVHKSPLIKNSTSDAPVSLHSARSTNISSEEMYMVMKHFGLELDDENERSLPPEDYFGSARLWPWEIIYYRRLKKGLISTGNYARRVAQNQEFRIVDKYVRSSSGWGELSEDHS